MSATGDLVIATACGEVRFHKAVIYQPASPQSSELRTEKQLIEGHYKLTGGNRVSFELGSYNKTKPLVIDPVLSYSSYLGGNDVDGGQSIALDSSGFAYITGQTISTDFPTEGPEQGTIGGGQDAFVTKFKADGSGLVYSTYLGGSGSENITLNFGLVTVLNGAASIAVDSAGEAYVTGYTDSKDFPLKNPLAGQTSLKGTNAAFVTKLSADGGSLFFSTYLGGSGGDCAAGIALDSSGDAYVVGQTFSLNFPITSSAFQTASNGVVFGGSNAFFTRIKSDGSAIQYSSYLGGNLLDSAASVAVDSNGAAYVTGQTSSSALFPTTRGAFNTTGHTSNFVPDAFVAKIDPSKSGASSLVYSTYLGGGNCDLGLGIAVDSSGDAYVTGLTMSTDFPVAKPFQKSLSGGMDGFVTELKPDGSGLLYSTYLGGGSDFGVGIAVDATGAAYVAGVTGSSKFPVAAAIQSKFGGGNTDAFLAKLAPGGSRLLYSTYLGGSGDDMGLAWRLTRPAQPTLPAVQVRPIFR